MPQHPSAVPALASCVSAAALAAAGPPCRSALCGSTRPLGAPLSRALLVSTLPRIFGRRIMRQLPAELGTYLLEAGRGFRVGGELAVVGPPLSSVDADLAFAQPERWGAKSKDAKSNARSFAAAQEARSMLGARLRQALAKGAGATGAGSSMPDCAAGDV
jgi:hypothetical protein